jgi:hypothetical protein
MDELLLDFYEDYFRFPIYKDSKLQFFRALDTHFGIGSPGLHGDAEEKPE